MVDGWPGRAGRSNFGVTMRDERRQVNPADSLSAAQVNQEFWQVGAFGLCSPKATLFIFPPGDPPAHISVGLFAWNQTIYNNPGATEPLPTDVAALTVNGTGDMSVEFDSTVLGRPDDNGDQQQETLGFQFGFADVNLYVSGTRGFAEFELVSSVEFRVRTFLAGTPSAQPFAVMVW